ncbi:MAG: flagellar motor switch protein FliN [bacterium]
MADDDVLSDDEIEALLDEEEGGGGDAGGGDAGMNMERVREVYEEIAETVENILATILSREVESRLIECVMMNKGELQEALDEQNWVVVSSELAGDLSGTARYVLPENIALQMADVMMGQEGESPPEEFDDVYESAIVEMYNQLVNSLATKLNELTGAEIELKPPESEVVETSEFYDEIGDGEFLWVEYTLSVEELFDSGSFFELQPASVAEMLANSGEEPAEEQPSEAPAEEQTPKAQSTADGGGKADGEKEVKNVDFPQFDATEGDKPVGNINMLMDVPMEVSVELGRTNLQVKEILNLGAGSIIELDRLAGEPVDLLINGRLVARGEVVVIDENFGVRVTSIVSPMERIK